MGRRLKKLFSFDFAVLLQLVVFLLLYFYSNNSYKSVILYFSFMIFFCYWMIKIVFSKEVINKKL